VGSPGFEPGVSSVPERAVLGTFPRHLL